MPGLTKRRPVVAVCRPIPEAGLALLRESCELRENPSDKVFTPAELARFVAGSSAILSLLTDHIDATILKAAGEQLKVVANYAVGFDNIVLADAQQAGVAVTNTPGLLTEAVAEHALALMLAAGRRLVEADEYVRAGSYKQWEPMLFIGQPLVGQTLGLIGSGRIGASFGLMAHRALRMRVIYHDVAPCSQLERLVCAKRVSLHELLSSADVVSLHVPLLPSTTHLVGADELKLMKPTAMLINTARGPVVDEAALIKALQSGEIWSAALDVFEHEPKISPILRKLKNVVLTPHIGSATGPARDLMSVMAARNILAVLSGKPPLNPVS